MTPPPTDETGAVEGVVLTSRADIRVPLRPLARILRARDDGTNPDRIEAANLRVRLDMLAESGWRSAEWRLLVLAALFFAGYSLIGARMATLASTPPAEVVAWQAEDIQDDRADIVDRNGRVLATNLVTNSLYAEMRYMIDGARAARELGRIIPELDVDRLSARLTNPNLSFVWIRSRLSPEQAQAVHDIGEPGLMLGPRRMRLYPNGNVAAHVLGGTQFGAESVAAAEIVGVAGIEHRLNTRLRDPDLADVPVQLSLDLTVQAVTAEVLAGGMAMMNARAAAAVLMDAHTGEIVAMVSLPDFDPNARPAAATSGDPGDSPLFNHAVQGAYELGSVMKAFTVAQALDLGLVSPTTMIETTPVRVGTHTIRESSRRADPLSVTDVFVASSNPGTVRLAQRIGGERQRAFLSRLGLLDPVPLEVSEFGFSRPQFDRRWTEASALSISFGHGITTSPVHLATAYSTLVNGGFRVTPTLLRRPNPERGEALLSPQTSAHMRRMMREVIVRGTARRFGEVAGYAPGGKTGTAEKPNPRGGYFEDRVIATFASAFPMNDPRYVLVVMLDEATEGTGRDVHRTAGWTAVPVSAEITRRVAPLLGLRPQSEAEIAAGLALR